METKLFDKKVLEKEAKIHRDFLNTVFGLACFTLSFTCANMSNPQKAAALCLFMIIPMWVKGYFYFPPTMRAVRELAKETKDSHTIELDKYLRTKYYGLISMLKKNIMYWSGLMFFILILAFPEVSAWVVQ